MKKSLRIVFVAFNMLGWLIYLFCSLFRSSLSDFWQGFCDGSSIVLLVIGSAYFIRCAIKKENPYDFK
jgi:hypothetical protein